MHDIYVEGWWKGDYFAWAGDLFAGALYITIASYIFMRKHLKFYSAPTGSRPTIADLSLLPCESRSLHVTSRTRPSPFSACNIEKWVWPGNEASTHVHQISLHYLL